MENYKLLDICFHAAKSGSLLLAYLAKGNVDTVLNLINTLNLK
jgi:hypothetical protein